MSKFPVSRRSDKVSNWHSYLHTVEQDPESSPDISEETTHLEVEQDPESPDSTPMEWRNGVTIHNDQENLTLKPGYRFTRVDLLLGILSVFLFIGDILGDIYLAWKYFQDGLVIFGTVTIVLVAGPSLVMCCLGMHWYLIGYKKRKSIDNTESVIPQWLWILRFALTIFQLGPLIRSTEYLYYGWMSIRLDNTDYKAKYYNRMVYEGVDASLLRFFESFLESAPQLVFQLFAWATLKPDEDVVTLSVRIIILLFSWGSISLSLTSYQKSLRNSRKEQEKMTIIAVTVYFIWRACEVGTRIICFSLFAIVFQLWIFLPVLLHWFLVTLWILQQKTRLYSKYWPEKIFNVICGYIMIFCFLNLCEGITRFRYLLYYGVFYLENGLMIGVWLWFVPFNGEWYYLYGLVVVLVLSALHILFLILYYKFVHPRPENIKICLDWNRAMCFESMCHQFSEDVTD